MIVTGINVQDIHNKGKSPVLWWLEAIQLNVWAANMVLNECVFHPDYADESFI